MLSRRAFLGWLATTIPAAAIVRRAHAAAVEHLLAASTTLRALGAALLPTELGSAGIDRAVADFQAWITGYHEGAEVLHGYGTSRLRFMGPTPATRWTRQLDDLETQSQSAHGQPFAQITLDQRRALLRSTLANERAMPADRASVGGANHVAVALLGHFYGGSEATDLCYESAIGRNNCRPLETSGQKPTPLKKAAGGQPRQPDRARRALHVLEG